jgi:hypothetical protein
MGRQLSPSLQLAVRLEGPRKNAAALEAARQAIPSVPERIPALMRHGRNNLHYSRMTKARLQM